MQISLGDPQGKFMGKTSYQNDFDDMKSKKVKKVRAISIG
jgi:hypothetical protein